MKVIKPQKACLLTRSFEHNRRCLFAVTVGVYFPFTPADQLLSEVAMWQFVMGELGPTTPLDAAMPKMRGEVLVSGRGYTLDRKPHAACAVRLKLGTIDKTLLCVGNRRWTRASITDPEPFTVMPLAWDRAFGGASHPTNRAGKGFVPRGMKAEGAALPNIEDPRRPLRAPGDNPTPVGMGPIDILAPHRTARAGTYDVEWKEKYYPGLAQDIDLGMFNAAPDDQQIKGFFRGDEPFALTNMHPDRPNLEGRLPGVTARAFVNVTTPEGMSFREAGMRLDTVWLFPHAERGVALFRGLLTTAEDDAADVRHLVVAIERMGQPRSTEHYQAALLRRLDRVTGPAATFDDADLLPALPPGSAPEDPIEALVSGPREPDYMGLPRSQGLLENNLRNRAERLRDEQRGKLRAAGLDPDRYLPRTSESNTPPTPAALAQQVAGMGAQLELNLGQAETARTRALDQVRGALAARGIRLGDPGVVRTTASEGGGPPRRDLRDQIAQMRRTRDGLRAQGVATPTLDAAVDDPELEAKLDTVEARQREAYVRYAHVYPQASQLEGDPAERVRAAVRVAYDRDRDLAGRDLTGAVLRGMDLRGANLRGAFLERADLTGADLTGADLTGAVLARADLTGAVFASARMHGANLGYAVLRDARFEAADLSEAVLHGADLRGADLTDADLTRANLLEVILGGTKLDRIRAASAVFLKTHFAGTSWQGARIPKASLLQANLAGADLAGADLTGAALLGVTADGVDFRGAKLDNLRVVNHSTLANARFDGASLEGANLRETHLAGASFVEARMPGVDFTESDLTGADLSRADVRRARMTRANLTDAVAVSANFMDATLARAKLHGADLSRTNLYRAIVVRTKGKARDLTGANLVRVQVLPRSDDGSG